VEWETNSKSDVSACPSSFRLAQANFEHSFRLAQANFEQDLYLCKYSGNLAPVIFLDHTTSEDGTVGSETSAYEIQTPENHPKGRIQHMI